jgi:serine/threonine-protein kinase
MDALDELDRTIDARLAEVGMDAATIERRPSSTIVPPTASQLDTAGRRAFEVLADLQQHLGRGHAERLELHGTLGEGGMGVVRLGTQTALARPVAVKSLRDDHKGDSNVLKLLREAWVTGTLEHPNVVPVYELALDGDGAPVIVLKKIEGVHWGSLMHDEPTVRRRFKARDLLEWNLQTLVQVCNAVRFAHSRGILHRDLKPENVMIGEFGEVYVVDWGIAVSLRDDGTGRLPLASQAREMAGTPLYMAPEMLGGEDARLSERTDVYLLGAVLCEIVTGRPPHRGERMMALVHSIMTSRPELPEDTPDELARIIRRAMEPDPDARFENVEQLRLALQGYLQHRDAAQLAEAAEERAGELFAWLAGTEHPEVTNERAFHLFGECRFGYRHALSIWPDNERAHAGLRRATERMIDHALSIGEPETATALLRELSDPPEELASRVARAREGKLAETEQLRRAAAELDPSAGRRTRAFLTVVAGALWVLVPGLTALSQHRGWSEIDHAAAIACFGGLLLVSAALAFWARESMRKTVINRQLRDAVAVGLGAPFLYHVVGLWTDTPWNGRDGVWLYFLLWGVLSAMLVTPVGRVFLIPTGIYFVAFVLCFLDLTSPWLIMAVADLLLLVTLTATWGRLEDLRAARDGIAGKTRDRKGDLA